MTRPEDKEETLPEDGERAFCKHCFEPAIFRTSGNPQPGRPRGFWYHDPVGNARVCHLFNWLYGVVYNPYEAAAGRVTIANKLTEEAARFERKRKSGYDYLPPPTRPANSTPAPINVAPGGAVPTPSPAQPRPRSP